MILFLLLIWILGNKNMLRCISREIMENPSVLILDEPMNGLGRNGVEEMRRLLLSLKALDKLIIIASHNAGDIEVLCDKVYEIILRRVIYYAVSIL